MRNLLPQLLATFTGPRQEVVVEWSKNSWTHNIFRLYELVFGRRVGIRAEQVSDSNGNVYSYTWENLFATYEGVMRNWIKGNVPKFSIVYVPQLQLAGLAQGGVTPFRFAIGFDVASGANNTSGGTLTYSHTCTGSGLTLVSSSVDYGTSPAVSVTYNAVSMSIGLQWSAQAFQVGKLFYLASPATGANNIVVTGAGAPPYLASITISLTGTNASPLGNVSTPGSGGVTTSFSNSITTANANSWVVAASQSDDTVANCAYVATGTNQTLRKAQDNTGGGQSIVVSTQTTTTAGSYTSSYTTTANTAYQIGCIEIIAAPSSGPTNVKAFDGVTQSTGVKTYFGVALASTKAVDGIN